MAQPGTAQAWNFIQDSTESLFPQGYPGSNPGRGAILLINCIIRVLVFV